LPRASLIEFSSRLPLSSLEILSPSIPDIVASSSTPEYKFNLITNLYEFTQPSYQTLSLPTLDVYLHLLTELMGAISSSSFDLQETLFHLDPHIKDSLANISGVHHLASLLTKFPRDIWSQWSLASFLFTLATSCPTNRENILSTLLECPDRDLVGELYRGFVRTSPLGRDYNPDALMGMHILLYLFV
jgi:ubiquitin-protein ligase E3 C